MKKYLNLIEKEKSTLILKLKKSGIYENFGQKEYRKFRDKVNADYSLCYADKAYLCDKYSNMVDFVNSLEV